jgi:hypothetical protein
MRLHVLMVMTMNITAFWEECRVILSEYNEITRRCTPEECDLQVHVYCHTLCTLIQSVICDSCLQVLGVSLEVDECKNISCILLMLILTELLVICTRGSLTLPPSGHIWSWGGGGSELIV